MSTDQDDAGHGRWASLYGRVLDALEDLLAGIDPATEQGEVPATPGWTVRQVVAHLAGTASDITTGRMAGAPGSAWTARQLAERDGVPMAELFAELRSTQRSFGIIAEGTSAGVFNAVVHHADLTEALGAHRQDEALILPVLQDQRHRWSTLSLRLPDDPDLAGLRSVDPYLLSRPGSPAWTAAPCGRWSVPARPTPRWTGSGSSGRRPTADGSAAAGRSGSGSAPSFHLLLR